MRCLYCDGNKESLFSLLFEKDCLCKECREQLKIKRRIIDLDGVKVETFYEYEGMFKSLLLQYKECLDEALKDVFLYNLEDYLKLKYRGYEILYVP